MPGWDSKFQKGDPLSLIARPPSPSQQIEGAATMATSFPSKQKLRATVNQPERQLTKPSATLFSFSFGFCSRFLCWWERKLKKKTVSLTSFSRKKITAAAQLRANDFSWLDLSNVWGALSSLLGGAIVEKKEKRPNCWKAPAFFHPDWLTTSGHSPTIHVYWHVLYTDIDWRERERERVYIYI